MATLRSKPIMTMDPPQLLQKTSWFLIAKEQIRRFARTEDDYKTELEDFVWQYKQHAKLFSKPHAEEFAKMYSEKYDLPLDW
jgi:preprotein translocase subunit Sss1